MDKLLEVNELTKRYSQGNVIARITLTAVDNVSFYIKPAEIFTLAGESGCGKTTTAKIVIGFEDATSGAILHSGKQQTSKRKAWITDGVQAIFQDPFSTFNPLRTVDSYFHETVQNFRLANSKQEAIDRIDQKLRLVGLTYQEFAGKYPNEFSGGQLQRISIARALVTDPKLIIADEPVSALDVSIQAQVFNLLQDLQQNLGLTYLFIAHDLSVVKHISKRVAVMYLGKIVELTEKKVLFRNPLHPYTQALISAIPVLDPDRKKKRIILQGDLPSPVNPPSGCRFHTRCWKAMDICKTTEPEWMEIAPDHYTMCHLHEACRPAGT